MNVKRTLLLPVLGTILILYSFSDRAFAADGLSPKAQALYEAEMAIAKEYLQSPQMTEDAYEKRVMAALPADAGEEDRRTTIAFARQSRSQLEPRRALAREEARFDPDFVVSGSGVASVERINTTIDALTKVNEILATIEKRRADGLTDFERQLKEAGVSPARIAVELNAARRTEAAGREEWEKVVAGIHRKSALNAARIEVLRFLAGNWGKWKFTDHFLVSSELLPEFRRLMGITAEAEKAAFGG